MKSIYVIWNYEHKSKLMSSKIWLLQDTSNLMWIVKFVTILISIQVNEHSVKTLVSYLMSKVNLNVRRSFSESEEFKNIHFSIQFPVYVISLFQILQSKFLFGRYECIKFDDNHFNFKIDDHFPEYIWILCDLDSPIRFLVWFIGVSPIMI